jgi:hypothetical protein
MLCFLFTEDSAWLSFETYKYIFSLEGYQFTEQHMLDIPVVTYGHEALALGWLRQMRNRRDINEAFTAVSWVYKGTRGSVVGWSTRLKAGRSRVRFRMRSLDVFNWPNTSSRTMALGSTQPLTEMSTRNLPGGKGRPAREADNLTAICEPIV